MIDIHSHIIPAVDDGCSDLEQALSLIKEENRQGITDIVLTPHYRAEYLPKREKIEKQFTLLKQTVNDTGIAVNLYLGQEIFVFDGIVNAIKNGKLFTMNGGKYVLLEFSTRQENDIADAVYTFVGAGFIPIVAHIERYFYADIVVAKEIKELGGLIQVNAGSVCGKFGPYKKKAAALIKAGLVDFVASDVHFKRKNHMIKAYNVVVKKFGQETADKLFTENAKAIIN